MKSLLATLAVLVALSAAALPARADEYSYQRTMDRTMPLSGARSVGIAGYNGNIHLHADGGKAVRIHAILKARSAEALKTLDVRTSREGDTLRIADVCPATRNLFFWHFRDCDIELDVYYPRTLSTSVHSENGNIVIKGSASAISVENGNGNVHIDGAGGPVSVKNSNGNVTVLGAPANVSVSNTNGNVHAALAKGWRGSAIAMHTNAGNVHLDVPPGFAATYTASVKLGEVENNATIRSGPVKVTATTTFGNVVISQE